MIKSWEPTEVLLLLSSLLLRRRVVVLVVHLLITPDLQLTRRKINLLLGILLDLSLHEPSAPPLDLLVEGKLELLGYRVDVVSLLDWCEVGSGIKENVEVEEEVEGLGGETRQIR